MQPSGMILREILHRKTGVVSVLVALTVSVAVIVAVRTVTISAREDISEQMHTLGANMIILPAVTSMSGYYTADFGDEVMPESYVDRLTSSEISEDLHHVIPKLSSPYRIAGRDLILTGVLPKNEHRPRPKWRTAEQGLFFEQPAEEEKVSPGTAAPRPVPMLSPEAAAKNRERASLEEIRTGEAFLGSEAARLLGRKAGDRLEIGSSEFKVAKVLEEMGSVDDLRVFIHLHQAQAVLQKGRVINAIELIGCGCERDLLALGGNIEKMLPGVKTRTITQIARTQRETVRLMEKFTLVALLLVIFVGWGLISNAAAADVLERRREIGILMAMGAASRFVFLFFLKKAAAMGLAGGLAGFFIGTFLATLAGPRIVGLGIEPQMEMLLWSLPGTVGLTVIFSWLPASRASRTDPAFLLMED